MSRLDLTDLTFEELHEALEMTAPGHLPRLRTEVILELDRRAAEALDVAFPAFG